MKALQPRNREARRSIAEGADSQSWAGTDRTVWASRSAVNGRAGNAAVAVKTAGGSLRRSMSARRATPSASAESLADTTAQRTGACPRGGAQELSTGPRSASSRPRRRDLRQVRDAGRVRLQYVD